MSFSEDSSEENPYDYHDFKRKQYQMNFKDETSTFQSI